MKAITLETIQHTLSVAKGAWYGDYTSWIAAQKEIELLAKNPYAIGHKSQMRVVITTVKGGKLVGVEMAGSISRLSKADVLAIIDFINK